MNLFDGMQQAAFAVVARTMGYDATWLPSAGGEQQQARVLYKQPTRAEELGDWEYNPRLYLMEYWIEDFPGLKEAADDKETEVVVINGQSHYVRAVYADWDGKNMRAILELS